MVAGQSLMIFENLAANRAPGNHGGRAEGPYTDMDPAGNIWWGAIRRKALSLTNPAVCKNFENWSVFISFGAVFQQYGNNFRKRHPKHGTGLKLV